MRLRMGVTITFAALVAAALGGCTAATNTVPQQQAATSRPVSTTNAPAGVPDAVYEAARRTLNMPGNHIAEPVEWVQTTVGAFEKVTRWGPGMDAATAIYVVQVRGSFANSMTTGPSATPGRSSVRAMLVRIGQPDPLGYAGYSGTHPIALSSSAGSRRLSWPRPPKRTYCP
jgi:hypothetical protein